MFQYKFRLKEIDEYIKIYEDTVKAKRNKEDKQKLIDIYEKIKIRYKEYLENKNSLEKMGKDEECCKLKKQLNDCYEKNERVVKALNEVVQEQKLEIQHLCPLCELERYNEKDHYLPKSVFPEYSIFMPNIIPACNNCNKRKSEKIVDESLNKQFLNVYFDSFPSIKILNAEIKFSEGVPYAKFYLSEENMQESLSEYEIIVIKNHFKNLDLLNRYERASASEIAKRIHIINSQKCLIDKQLIKDIYEKNLNNNIEIYGVNYWENVLDKEILENKFDDLFNFCKETV